MGKSGRTSYSNKKRHLLLFVALVVISSALTGFTYSLDRIFPDDKTSEAYIRFAGRDDLEVSYVKGFQLNDTMTVDVTVIQANDSAAWESLMLETGLSEDGIKSLRAAAKRKRHFVRSGYRKKSDISEKSALDLPNVDLLYWQYNMKTVIVYHVETPEQIDVIDYNEVTSLTKGSSFTYKLIGNSIEIIERIIEII